MTSSSLSGSAVRYGSRFEVRQYSRISNIMSKVSRYLSMKYPLVLNFTDLGSAANILIFAKFCDTRWSIREKFGTFKPSRFPIYGYNRSRERSRAKASSEKCDCQSRFVRLPAESRVRKHKFEIASEISTSARSSVLMLRRKIRWHEETAG